jgi:hypothetical protein
VRSRVFATASLLGLGAGCEPESLGLLPVDVGPVEVDAGEIGRDRPVPDVAPRRDVGPRPEYPDGCLPVDGYLFCLIAQVFEAARETCISAGGDLIIVESEAENQRVGDAFADWNPRPFWLGLTDDVVEDTWVWIDGQPLGPFEAWDVGEPNDLEGEDCSHGNWMEPRVWNDIDCFDRYPFICEFPAGSDIRCVVDDDCLLSFGRCVAGDCRVL